MSYFGNINPNIITNGAFDYWQRGTTGTSTATSYPSPFLADRFNVLIDTGNTGFATTKAVNRINSIATNNKSKYSIEATTTGAGSTGAGYDWITYHHVIPSWEAAKLAGQIVTLSLNARYLHATASGTPLTPRSSSFLDISYLNTEDVKTSGFTIFRTYSRGANNWLTGSHNITTPYSFTFTVPNVAGVKNGILIRFEIHGNASGTSTSSMRLALDQVKLELGAKPTPFIVKENDYWNCLRFFEKSYAENVIPGTASNFLGQIRGFAYNTIDFYQSSTQFQVPKWKIPTVTIYNPNTGAVGTARNYSASPQTNNVLGVFELATTGFNTTAVGGTLVADNLFGFHYTAESEITGF